MPTKVLIVDDHPVAREGMKAMISGAEIEVTGMASTGEEAVQVMTSQQFDVVLMDVRMHDKGGLSALDSMPQELRSVPIIMISGYDNPTYVARAAALGAADYLLKSTSRSNVMEAVRAAVRQSGPPHMSLLGAMQVSMLQGLDHSKLPLDVSLTNRESQVLRHITLGLSNKEIALSLEISVETVKEHVQNILRKLHANDRTDAAVRAIRMGVVD